MSFCILIWPKQTKDGKLSVVMVGNTKSYEGTTCRSHMFFLVYLQTWLTVSLG